MIVLIIITKPRVMKIIINITSTRQDHNMQSRDRLGARVQRTIQDQGYAKQGCRNAKFAEARYRVMKRTGELHELVPSS